MTTIEKEQQNYSMHWNKENMKVNQRKQLSHRHRNDHSIEAKSPIKIPPSSLKKDDLTFRLKESTFLHSNSPQHPWIKEDAESDDCKQTLPTLTKQEMKSQLRNLTRSEISVGEKVKLEEVIYVNQHECQLIDNLWQICNRLKITQNQYLRESLDIIHLEIRKMIALIAENSSQENGPLASSKKIKLQNYIAHSHCQKQIYHKQFESDHQLNQEFSSSRVLISSRIPEPQYENQNNRNKTELESKDELEVRKIMYMLEGRQKKLQSNAINSSSKAAGGRVRSERLSSLSSFNQNSSQDSGFTVFEIERCSDSSLCSEKETKASQQQFKKAGKVRREDKCPQVQQSVSSSEGSRASEGQQEVNVGNKRKVLNDIVAMLNYKYNKNIRLE